MELTIGLKGYAETIVDNANTANAAGSGTLDVFGTPYMIAIMEKAACDSLQSTLEAGKSSVGTRINILHTSATPIGMKVYAESVVTAIDGKKVTFSITAYDDKGEIGSGEHDRVIVDNIRFMERCAEKLSK